MHIHILTAEHFHVPGLITEAHADSSTATLKAVELVNIMLKDSRRKPTATAKNWRAKVEWLQDFHGAAHCYVEIAEHELVMAEVKEFRRTVEYYRRREESAGDDEGERLKSIKLVMLDDLIARAEGRTNG